MRIKYFAGLAIFLLIVGAMAVYILKDRIGAEELFYDDDQEGLTEQIVIRFSHVVAENTPKGLAAQRFADIVYERSGGRVRVEVFPNGALASDKEEFSALLKNDIQIIAPSFSKVTEMAPEWALFDLPFLFNDFREVEAAFKGEIGEYLLQGLSQHNVKGLALWSNGFKQMTSDQQSLRLPEDFANQSFRIMPSWIIEEQFKLMNAKPIPIPFNEVYDYLASGKVDGQENTISNIYSRKWQDLQRFMTVSNHGFLGYAIIMNGDFWKQLPEEIQTLLTEAMNETTAWNFIQSKTLNDELLNELEMESNLNIHYLTQEEREVWQETLKPVFQLFKQEVSPELGAMVEESKKDGK